MRITRESKRMIFVALAACTMAATNFVSSFMVTNPIAFRPLTTIRHDSSLFIKRRGRPKGPLRTIEVKPTMNDEITYDQLRVVTPNPKGKDEPLGIMSKAEALAKAQEMGGLDVILINENSDPPVCKIVDYSKYRYMKEKKAKELKKNSKATEIKEVKMSYKIDVHDYMVRKKNAAKFINQGNRVKITIMFRGREVQHDKLGFELIEKLAEDLEGICLREGKPQREGRNLSVIMTPRPEVVKAVNEGRRAGEKAKKKKREESLKRKREAAEVKSDSSLASEVNGSALDQEKELETLNAVALESAIEVTDESESDLTSSLDELLGKDSLTDDLFA